MSGMLIVGTLRTTKQSTKVKAMTIVRAKMPPPRTMQPTKLITVTLYGVVLHPERGLQSPVLEEALVALWAVRKGAAVGSMSPHEVHLCDAAGVVLPQECGL